MGRLRRNVNVVYVRLWLPFQPVDATPALLFSAGVSIAPGGANW